MKTGDERPDEEKVLRAFVTGEIQRGVAMERLGLDWYGDLLVKLNEHGIRKPGLKDCPRPIATPWMRRWRGSSALSMLSSPRNGAKLFAATGASFDVRRQFAVLPHADWRIHGPLNVPGLAG